MALIGWRAKGGAKLRVVPLGDSALLAEFSTSVDLDVNARIQHVAGVIRDRSPQWVRDVVPAVGTLAVHFDPASVQDPAAAREELRKLIEEALAAAPGKGASREQDLLELPVCYGDEYGADLEGVAAHAGLEADEVIRRHTATEHRVLMVGFAPGHPYIGGLDAKLAVPRRATPRTRVPEGSVAIANAQTAIYPFAISGGWNLIGRTPLRVFDAVRVPPALFAPGQRVRFVRIDRTEYIRLRATGEGRE